MNHSIQRSLACLLLAACTAAPGQLPPPATLSLSTGPMELGTQADLLVEGTVPGAPVRVYGSPRDTGAAFCIRSLGNLCTDLSQPGVLLASGTADANGNAALNVLVPNTTLRMAWLQAISYDGSAATFSQVVPAQLFQCGDGIVDLPEECDDSNFVDGDRCSNTCEAARPILSDPGPVLKLLFIGNSYTSYHGLRNIVDDLATQLGIFTDVQTSARTAGGRRLPQHEAEAASGGTLASLLDPSNPNNDWDAVIIQEQSQIPGFPESNTDRVGFMNAVADLDARVEAVGAETALFMTWGRRDGDSINPGLYPDYQTMQDRLSAGYYEAAAQASRPDRRVHVIPVGEAWNVVHDRDNTDFRSLYAGDGSHPSFDGSYLTALVMLNRLLGTDLTAMDVLRDANGQPRAPIALHDDAAMVGLP